MGPCDGTTANTRDPVVHHDFRPEEKRSPGAQQTYVVRVRALDLAGHELALGMTNVVLLSLYAHAKRDSHVLQLKAEQPALPEG